MKGKNETLQVSYEGHMFKWWFEDDQAIEVGDNYRMSRIANNQGGANSIPSKLIGKVSLEALGVLAVLRTIAYQEATSKQHEGRIAKTSERAIAQRAASTKYKVHKAILELEDKNIIQRVYHDHDTYYCIRRIELWSIY